MAHAVSITQTVDTANTVEWAKLALKSPKARVLRVTRVRYDANRPFALEEVVLPLDRFVGLSANDGDLPDTGELAQRYGLSLGRATEWVSVVPATEDVASHLGITGGTRLVKLERITETVTGEPIEWRVAFKKVELGGPGRLSQLGL